MFNLPKLDEGAQARAPQQSRRDLLESTRLSRLPEPPVRKPITFENIHAQKPSVVAICAGCDARLDRDDEFQQSLHGCRKCIGIYARIDAAIEEASKRKTRELLEKLSGGINDDV